MAHNTQLKSVRIHREYLDAIPDGVEFTAYISQGLAEKLEREGYLIPGLPLVDPEDDPRKDDQE